MNIDALKIDESAKKNIQAWLDGDYDEATKQAIRNMMEGDQNELNEAFYRNLEFGTGGLRGIMGAGTNGNTQMDAANLLKPILATGQVKFIGSTTFEEYQKNFEKEPKEKSNPLANTVQKDSLKNSLNATIGFKVEMLTLE